MAPTLVLMIIAARILSTGTALRSGKEGRDKWLKMMQNKRQAVVLSRNC